MSPGSLEMGGLRELAGAGKVSRDRLGVLYRRMTGFAAAWAE